MAKRRKSVASRLDEVDRTMYSTFSTAANSLSQLYTQAMNQQKISFQAGERHALEKLHQWIVRQQEEGSRLGLADIVAYLQNELDYGGDETPASPRLQSQHNLPAPGMQLGSPALQLSSVLSSQGTGGHGPRLGCSPDRTKNLIFSNALSSPVRRSLQPYQFAQGAGVGSYQSNISPTGNESRNSEISCQNQNRDPHAVGSADTTMDMHSDSPAHESY